MEENRNHKRVKFKKKDKSVVTAAQKEKQLMKSDYFEKFEVLQAFERTLELLEGGYSRALSSWSDYRLDEWKDYQKSLFISFEVQFERCLKYEFPADMWQKTLRRALSVAPEYYGARRVNDRVEFRDAFKMDEFSNRFPGFKEFCYLNCPIVKNVIVSDVVCDSSVCIVLEKEDVKEFDEMIEFNGVVGLIDNVFPLVKVGRRNMICEFDACFACNVPFSDTKKRSNIVSGFGNLCQDCQGERTEFNSRIKKLHRHEWRHGKRIPCVCVSSGSDCEPQLIKCFSCGLVKVDLYSFRYSNKSRVRPRCYDCWGKVPYLVYFQGTFSISDLFNVIDVADKIIDFSRSWCTMSLVSRQFNFLVRHHVLRGLLKRHYFMDAVKTCDEFMNESNSEDYLDDEITSDRCVTQLLEIPRLFLDVTMDIGAIDVGPCLNESYKLKAELFSRYHPARFDMWCPYLDDYSPIELLPVVMLIDWNEAFQYSSSSIAIYCFLQPHFREHIYSLEHFDSEFDYSIHVSIFFSHFKIYSLSEIQESNQWSFSSRFFQYYKYDYDLPVGSFKDRSHEIVKSRNKDIKTLHSTPISLRSTHFI
jgi:hypothetical protein